MQITCNRARSLSDLLCLEIISGIECKRPITGNLQVTRHVDILRILKRITHRITIDRLTTILGNTERIVHIQRPWHLKYLITVTIRLCFFYPLLSNRFVTGRISFFFVGTVLFLLLIVILIFPEQLLPGIIIECIVDGRSPSLETPEAAIRPFGAVTHYYITRLIECIGIGCEYRVHIQRIVIKLLELHTQTHIQVTPWLLLCSHIIRKIETDFINQTDFHKRVFLVTVFHLQVVRHIKTNRSGLFTRSCTKLLTGIRRVILIITVCITIIFPELPETWRAIQ